MNPLSWLKVAWTTGTLGVVVTKLAFWAMLLAVGYTAGAITTTASATNAATTAALKAQQEQFDVDRKADHEQMKQFVIDTAVSMKENTSADKAITAMQTASSKLIGAIRNVPVSKGCITSPVSVAYYNWLRQQQQASREATGGPASLPATP